MPSPSDLENQYVYLDLAAKGLSSNTWGANRIALKCESISINTSKQVISHALPGSGLIYGESKTAALDLGMTDKTVSLSGIITEQAIIKNWDFTPDKDGVYDPDTTMSMTAHEVAQLIHSYVDSSFFQKNQNPNKLIILMPSRVASDWGYYTIADDGWDVDVTDATPVEQCPLIPFTYKTRNKDNTGTLDFAGGINSFPSIVTNSSTKIEYALKGFVRNFSTTFAGGQPFIEFSMDFQIADVQPN
tara:strand:- start:213 stop:947 length:735 start_codon:yes stop_codon:yes gene_type:complete